MKEEIMNKLKDFIKEQGVLFTSEKDADEYYRGLVEIIEELVNEEKFKEVEVVTFYDKPKEKFIITHRSVMGALADYAVQQSPYHRPDNLEIVLDKFHDLIKDELNETMKQYVKKFETWNECHEWIATKLHTIPEFMLWNERKNGNKAQFGFSGAGHHDNGDVTLYGTEADNNFIDLDALTRNITNLSLKD